MTEMYASACCGTVFVPGHGPDDLHDAEAGSRLVIEQKEREVPVTAHGAEIGQETEAWERVHRITNDEAVVYDAVRAGDCPACGATRPGLTLVDDGGAA